MIKTYRLRQDTPMWVFNPSDPGCGLRATEVKPKLDRYLIHKSAGKIDKNWFVPDTGALDYKMSLEYGTASSLPSEERYTDKAGRQKSRAAYPLFFGNMGDGNRKRLMVFKDVTMSIWCGHPALSRLIEENLQGFFDSHSFGTRQSKGFGCFSLIGKSSEKKCAGARFKFHVNCNEGNFPDLFNAINNFHKAIRSGINFGRIYQKSLLYQYAKSLGKRWDKSAIRHTFEYQNDVYKVITGQIPPKPYDNNMRNLVTRSDVRADFNAMKGLRDSDIAGDGLFRDALGLASHQEWMKYRDTITIDSPTVKRFKSPVFYRPVAAGDGYDVYIYIDELPSDFCNAVFTIRNNRKSAGGWRVADVFRQPDAIAKYFDFIIKGIRSRELKIESIVWKQFSSLKKLS